MLDQGGEEGVYEDGEYFHRSFSEDGGHAEVGRRSTKKDLGDLAKV
jgi:hypothetical protein